MKRLKENNTDPTTKSNLTTSLGCDHTLQNGERKPPPKKAFFGASYVAPKRTAQP